MQLIFFVLWTVSPTWKVHISIVGFHNLLQLHLHRFSGYGMILSKDLLPLVDQSTDVAINSVIPKMEIEPVLVTLANLLPHRTHSNIKFVIRKGMFLPWLMFFSWFIAKKNLVTWLCDKVIEEKSLQIPSLSVSIQNKLV